MRLILLCFMAFHFFALLGQKSYTLSFNEVSYQQIQKKIPANFKDSLSVIRFLQNIQIKAVKKGYILSSFDSIHFKNTEVIVHFTLGDKINEIHLAYSEADIQFLKQKANLKEKQLANIPFQAVELSKLLERLYHSGVDNGYPFTKIYLDSINYNQGLIRAKLMLNKGELYRIKQIHIKGDSLLSKQMISSLIRIKEGDLYNEANLASISKQLKQVNHLQELKPHEILFTKEGVELFVYVKSNPISSVNGVLGLQPNPITEKLAVTGELSLKLVNVFHKSELVQLNWRSIQPGTQSLNSVFNYPYLFKSSFGIDAGFNLYKKDSTFLETKAQLGVQYQLPNGSFLKAYYQNYGSSILSGASSSTLNFSTVKTGAYGLSFLKKELDYIPNPSEGYVLLTDVALGKRNARKSDTSEVFSTTTYRITVQLNWFIPIAKRHVLRFGANAETYYAPDIYENELFRFGGLTSLRGFNEDELFATTKSILTLEYRFLVDQNSHAFAFFDQGMYENTSTNYQRDFPFGFGAGFSFGTQLGIFSISYGIGKQYDNPLLLKNGKVHFGYIAYF
jgi:outer membrane protein assembly factor BamA